MKSDNKTLVYRDYVYIKMYPTWCPNGVFVREDMALNYMSPNLYGMRDYHFSRGKLIIKAKYYQDCYADQPFIIAKADNILYNHGHVTLITGLPVKCKCVQIGNNPDITDITGLPERSKDVWITRVESLRCLDGVPYDFSSMYYYKKDYIAEYVRMYAAATKGIKRLLKSIGSRTFAYQIIISRQPKLKEVFSEKFWPDGTEGGIIDMIW